jgi:hypothetical protein
MEIYSENLKGRDYSGDLSTESNIITTVGRNRMRKCGLDSFGS